MTVYAAEQQTAKQIDCAGPCTSIWIPVTVPTGTKPVAGSGVTAQLKTVPLADGQSQVVSGDDPLYTFSLDKSPGSTQGNGVMDSFNGDSFTWHALTASGNVVSTTATPSPSSSDDNGGSGYRY